MNISNLQVDFIIIAVYSLGLVFSYKTILATLRRFFQTYRIKHFFIDFFICLMVWPVFWIMKWYGMFDKRK